MEERKERERPTTKPRTVKRRVLTATKNLLVVDLESVIGGVRKRGDKWRLTTWCDKLVDTGNAGSPETDAEDWYDHARENRTVHAHEVWKLGVAIEVARSNLCSS